MTVSSPIQPSLDSPAFATTSVGDFFRQINWHGEASLGSDAEMEADKPYETVGQFFATFPWQGTTSVMPSDDQELLEDQEMPPITNDTLTLEDLSALF